MKQLSDFAKQPINRPLTPMVDIRLENDKASHRLISHVTKRVIRKHKEELKKLAYK